MASLDRAMKGVRRVFHVAADYRLWAQKSRRDLRDRTSKARAAFLKLPAKHGVERVVYTSTVATIAVPIHGSALPNEETHATLEPDDRPLQTLEISGRTRSHQSAGCRNSGRDRESHRARRPGRLEADADGPHHRRFSQWQDARVRRHGLESRRRRRRAPPGICWPRKKAASASDTSWAPAI